MPFVLSRRGGSMSCGSRALSSPWSPGTSHRSSRRNAAAFVVRGSCVPGCGSAPNSLMSSCTHGFRAIPRTRPRAELSGHARRRRGRRRVREALGSEWSEHHPTCQTIETLTQELTSPAICGPSPRWPRRVHEPFDMGWRSLLGSFVRRLPPRSRQLDLASQTNQMGSPDRATHLAIHLRLADKAG